MYLFRYLFLGLFVFFVSPVLHLSFTLVYHWFNSKNGICPKSSSKESAIKPVVRFPNEGSAALSEKLPERYHLLASNARVSSGQPKAMFPDPLKPGRSRSIYEIEIIEPQFRVVPYKFKENQI